MPTKYTRSLIALGVALFAFGSFASVASANHSWGFYHWPHSANPLVLSVGDSVTSAWDAYLNTAIADWNPSSVLELTKVSGANISRPKQCRPITGRIEVCNARYGYNGWLGIAQIWISGDHITQAVAKMNDTYFGTASYNTPAWKRLVMCQEIAHGFGLDHQDEMFDNVNLGTCMDYTNDPDGGAGGASATDASNEHPNAHDFEQLASIYAHLDSALTALNSSVNGKGGAPADLENPSEWGQGIREDAQGKKNVFERDLGNGNKVITHVFWVEDRAHEEK